MLLVDRIAMSVSRNKIAATNEMVCRVPNAIPGSGAVHWMVSSIIATDALAAAVDRR